MESVTDEKNFLAIKRLDQFATEIITKSTTAAVFNFIVSKKTWVKANIDGSLFVYRRLDKPSYSMIVANKNSRDDFILPITDALRFKYMPPYIYMYTHDGLIKGLYVYGEDECKRIYDVLKSLRNSDGLDDGNEKRILKVSEKSDDTEPDETKVLGNGDTEVHDNEGVAKESATKEPSTSDEEEQKKKAEIKEEEKANEMVSEQKEDITKESEGESNAKDLAKILDIDVFVEEIITKTETAGVCEFDLLTKNWNISDIEGPLFIYRRIDKPYYSIIVISRESTKNYVLPITPALKFKYKPPFIYMFTSDEVKKSLFLSDKKECKRITRVLMELQQSLEASSKKVQQNFKVLKS